MEKLVRPAWAKTAKVRMAELEINQKQLAKEVGTSEGNISNVLSGRLISPNLIQRIHKYLDIEQ